MTISGRIKEALQLRDMKQADLVTKTGIGKSSISTYISGFYEPKQKNIYKIAKALNVSESWLMGLDVPIERIEAVTNDDTLNLTSDERQLIIKYRNSDDETTNMVKRLLDFSTKFAALSKNDFDSLASATCCGRHTKKPND